MKKVIVGMSGGVDSSVAAYVLQKDGWDVEGVFMKNWEDDSKNPSYRSNNQVGCSWEDDYADVRAVCDMLGIPYRVYNFVDEYKDAVFHYFLTELERGRTPNPDVMCNQEIKFKLFFEKALSQDGVEAVATGHYARSENGHLKKPKDLQKDQTYFLHRIEKDILPQVLFPLAEYTKAEVRAIASEQGFVTANKKDSTGICFIGNIDYNQFIAEHIPKKPGRIITLDGTDIGAHDGLHFFTLGQRKGVNIGGTGPYYVVDKRIDTNELVVTSLSEDPQLYHSTCTVQEMHQLEEIEYPLECQVQIRYRQDPQPARVEQQGEDSIVHFAQPQRAVTPGQSAVLYAEDTVLGGGIINTVSV